MRKNLVEVAIEEKGIFKGGTLIINLNSIEMIGSDYVFSKGDKVRIALKKHDTTQEVVLYAEALPNEGETEIQHTFTAEQTNEKLELYKEYILQADLINSNGTFPMLLQRLEVIGMAIPDKE